MRVLISGMNGLVGRAVADRLTDEGHQPVALRRSDNPPTPDQALWEPIRRNSWTEDVGDVDVVVHLAGENIAARRWSPEQKHRIKESRIAGTRQLCEYLAGLDKKPSVLVSASAVGYYGDRGHEFLTENSESGRGFLAEVCREWEAATQPAQAAGIRVVRLRIGMVLASGGGALAKMLPLFRLGLGGRLGGGHQYMSWISLRDLVRVVLEALTDESLSGSVNAVSPGPVTNLEFTRALGRAVRRPALFAVPAPILRLAAGEMADQMLLTSARVVPRKLLDHGFNFAHPDLEQTLNTLIQAGK